VLSVGAETYIRKQTLLDPMQVTPLQEKLEVIADQIGTFGFLAAFFGAVVVSIVSMLLSSSVDVNVTSGPRSRQ